MKKIIILTISILFSGNNLYANEFCLNKYKNGLLKHYLKCVESGENAASQKKPFFKGLNTDSKLTDAIKGASKPKIKLKTESKLTDALKKNKKETEVPNEGSAIKKVLGKLNTDSKLTDAIKNKMNK
jgi:hypothetical protein